MALNTEPSSSYIEAGWWNTSQATERGSSSFGGWRRPEEYRINLAQTILLKSAAVLSSIWLLTSQLPKNWNCLHWKHHRKPLPNNEGRRGDGAGMRAVEVGLSKWMKFGSSLGSTSCPRGPTHTVCQDDGNLTDNSTILELLQILFAVIYLTWPSNPKLFRLRSWKCPPLPYGRLRNPHGQPPASRRVRQLPLRLFSHLVDLCVVKWPSGPNGSGWPGLVVPSSAARNLPKAFSKLWKTQKARCKLVRKNCSISVPVPTPEAHLWLSHSGDPTAPGA